VYELVCAYNVNQRKREADFVSDGTVEYNWAGMHNHKRPEMDPAKNN
jgi:hypothetical protein